MDGELKNTINFAQSLYDNGAEFVAIHLRYRNQRSSEEAHWELSKELKESLKFPIIFNGDIESKDDIIKYKELSGCDSFMIGRGALKNFSIFNKEKDLSLEECLKEYIDICESLDNKVKNTKYVLQEMLRYNFLLPKPIGIKITASKTYSDLKNSLKYINIDKLSPDDILPKKNKSKNDINETNIKKKKIN